MAHWAHRSHLSDDGRLVVLALEALSCLLKAAAWPAGHCPPDMPGACGSMIRPYHLSPFPGYATEPLTAGQQANLGKACQKPSLAGIEAAACERVLDSTYCQRTCPGHLGLLRVALNGAASSNSSTGQRCRYLADAWLYWRFCQPPKRDSNKPSQHRRSDLVSSIPFPWTPGVPTDLNRRGVKFDLQRTTFSLSAPRCASFTWHCCHRRHPLVHLPPSGSPAHWACHPDST